jgi:hypothetical protein
MQLESLPGLVLDQKYRADRQLGRGAMGAVFHATHLGTTRSVAVKVIVRRGTWGTYDSCAQPISAGPAAENLLSFRPASKILQRFAKIPLAIPLGRGYNLGFLSVYFSE